MKKLPKKTKNILSIAAIVILFIVLMLVDNTTSSTDMLRTVLQLSVIYALATLSMNILNGYTGLFSLGQAGFMAVGAYLYGILTIPVSAKPGVYYLYGVADAIANVQLSPILALILAGLFAALLAAIIGAPVLRLKSDYFAIATLGFAEIVRILVASSLFNQVTNGSLGLKAIPGYDKFLPGVIPPFYVPFIVVGLCILAIVLLINSSYGRAFKAIREDEIAAEAMGINLAHTKLQSFIASSFFAGIAGALLAMFLGAITSTTFTVMLTYNILLILVIGGMGSITGSILAAFLVTFAKEWWLRFLDSPLIIGSFQVPLLRTGFRMVVFSILLMVVVLFWRRGIMGQNEFSWDAIYNWFLKLKNKFSGKKPADPATGGAEHE
jgi:branched-chain amino acid transport system permease protein